MERRNAKDSDEATLMYFKDCHDIEDSKEYVVTQDDGTEKRVLGKDLKIEDCDKVGADLSDDYYCTDWY